MTPNKFHLILVFLITLSAFADDHETSKSFTSDFVFEELNFRKLDVLKNRSVGNVHQVAQDSLGFIWFASEQGAYRFDGYRLKTFQNIPEKTNSIAHNSVYSIHLDSSSNLWFGTQSGISKFDPSTESFTNYPDSEHSDPNLSSKINQIVSDNNGRVIATSESGFIYRYDSEIDQFTALNSIPFGYIKSIFCDPNNIFWIGFEDGVIRYDHEKRQSKHFPDTNDNSAGIANNFVNAIYYFSEDNIWLGRSNNGLARLNALSGSVELIEEVGIENQYTTGISYFPDQGVLVTSNTSLSLYNTDGELLHRLNNETQNGSIPTTGMNAFYSDSFGNQWIGSNFDALNISSSRKPFKKFPEASQNQIVDSKDPVTAFLQDSKGNFWIGNGKSGLDLHPSNGGEVTRFRHDPSDPESIVLQPILKVFEDSHGDIWIGTFRGGLQKFLPTTNSFQTFLADPSNPNSIGGQDIRDFAEDEKGNLWINTHGNGIDYFNVETQEFTRLQSSFSAGAPSLIDDWVYCLLYDDNFNLWIGSTKGISVLNTKTGTITNHQPEPTNNKSLSGSIVKDIIQDSKGRIWVGTENGLNLYNPMTTDFSLYSINHGLPNKNVRSIVEDNQGNIWVATANGLAKLNPQTQKITSYFVEDGLASNEYFEGSVFKDKYGSIYLGHNRGISKFTPSSIIDNPTPPEVYLTDFLVLNESLTIDPKSNAPGVLQNSILDTNSITLQPNQRAITIEFIGLHYIQSNKTQYSYKLEGFDTEWSLPSSNRAATYTNLDPGNYQFRVKASNNDGVWNEQGTSLSIEMLPPFWQTTSFMIFATLAAIVIPSILVYWRFASIKSKKRDLEFAVEQRTEELQNAHKELETAYQHILSYQNGLRKQ